MANDDTVKLPPGYEDAKPANQVQRSAAGAANIKLPAGFEDAKPATAAAPPAPSSQQKPASEATISAPHERPFFAGLDNPNLEEEKPKRLSQIIDPGYTQEGRKEHPVRAWLGDRMRGLEEVMTPAVTEAAILFGGPGGLGGGREPIVQRPGVPAMSAPGGGRLPRVSAAPREFGGTPKTVFEEPRQLGPVPQTERGPGRLQPVTPKPAELEPIAKAPDVEPMQRKPLVERRLGQAGRKPTVESIVNEATGVKPLEPNVPLREQSGAGRDLIKEKYPDPEVRQLVRANGERIYEAAKGSPERLQAIHDLTRVDLRQALINAGEDMGQRTITNSKFAGEGGMSREDAFNRLLDKGLKPDEIVDLAKRAPAELPTAELKAGETTEDRYFDKTKGEWNPERVKAVHDPAINEQLEGKMPPKGRKPIAILTMGGTGAGKSTLTRPILEADPNIVNVDADRLKLKIPEFEGLKQRDPKTATLRIHEESSYLSKRLVKEAVRRGLDFIFDKSTGGESDGLYSKLKQAGYDVKIKFVDVPTDEAIARAKWRAANSPQPENRGRIVPENIIREKHQSAARSFDLVRRSPYVDEVEGWDTTGKEPRKFYERNAKGENIIDRERLERVRQKAEGRESRSTATDRELVLTH